MSRLAFIGFSLALSVTAAGCAYDLLGRDDVPGDTETDAGPIACGDCTQVPAAFCIDGKVRRFSAPASCVAGTCRFPSEETACENGCESGRCLGCEASCGDRECGSDGCGAACGACDAPPVPSCRNATELETFAPEGTCTEGECRYVSTVTTCPGACASGACVDCSPSCGARTCGPDGCGGSCGSCRAPPASVCSGSALRTFALAGTCGPAGACEYESLDTNCPFDCAGGACQDCTPDCVNRSCGGDGCGGLCGTGTCQSPPPAKCASPSLLTTFTAIGTCSTAGTCGYASSQQGCPYGCANGACQACPPESGPAFCARLGRNCQQVSGTDNCGTSRTENCGSCMDPLTCGSGGTANVCGCTASAIETDAAFCARLGRSCGPASGIDNCGLARSVTCVPDGMVFIAGATFQMGSDEGDGFSDEVPRHAVTLSAYCIDRTETTTTRYAACVTATSCPAATTGGACNAGVSNRGTHPINCVKWADAGAFCRWAGGALPTEAQWEYAARWTDGRMHPWGNGPPAATLLNMDQPLDGWVGGTAPVGTYPLGASPLGVLDLSGNVCEWIADWYAPYPFAAQTNPTGPAVGAQRVFRGGSWYTADEIDLRAAFRGASFPTTSASDLGFRCVRAASP